METATDTAPDLQPPTTSTDASPSAGPQRTTRLIVPHGPFDLAVALDYVRTWTGSTFEGVDDAAEPATPDGGPGRWQRALRLHNVDLLLTLRAAPGATTDAGTGTGTTTSSALSLDIATPLATPAAFALAADAAEARLRRIFSLDTDPTAFHAFAAGEPMLAELVARQPLLRPVLVADPFEALLWAVLGQQINVTFARTLKLRLVDLVGRTLEVDGQSARMMPLAEDVAVVEPEALRAIQFSRQKIDYVLTLSQAVATGELDLAAVAQMSADEAIATLTARRGVGRWTAEYMLMRAFGNPDALPAGDVSLQLLIGTALLGKRATEAELRQATAHWSPWRGWAAFHVWANRQFGG